MSFLAELRKINLIVSGTSTEALLVTTALTRLIGPTCLVVLMSPEELAVVPIGRIAWNHNRNVALIDVPPSNALLEELRREGHVIRAIADLRKGEWLSLLGSISGLLFQPQTRGWGVANIGELVARTLELHKVVPDAIAARLLANAAGGCGKYHDMLVYVKHGAGTAPEVVQYQFVNDLAAGVPGECLESYIQEGRDHFRVITRQA